MRAAFPSLILQFKPSKKNTGKILIFFLFSFSFICLSAAGWEPAGKLLRATRCGEALPAWAGNTGLEVGAALAASVDSASSDSVVVIGIGRRK